MQDSSKKFSWEELGTSEADDSDLPAQMNYNPYQQVYRLRQTRDSSETNPLKREFQLRRTQYERGGWFRPASSNEQMLLPMSDTDKRTDCDKRVRAVKQTASNDSLFSAEKNALIFVQSRWLSEVHLQTRWNW